jgi:protein-S-isoprenylcysteine O-methyltransferase Ste14
VVSETVSKRKIIPPVYLFMTLLLMWFMQSYFPIYQYIHEPVTYTGVVGVIAGIVMAAISAGMFKKAGTGIVPFDEATALVKAGFYRFTRNPMYLGMFLMLIGVAILFGSAGAILPILVFFMIIRNNFVLPEERFLEACFDQEYLDYKSSVRRWL